MDRRGCAKPIEHTKQQEEAVDIMRYPKTDLERLCTRERAIRGRLRDPRVPAEEKERARVRLEKTEEEIASLKRCAEMPVTAG